MPLRPALIQAQGVQQPAVDRACDAKPIVPLVSRNGRLRARTNDAINRPLVIAVPRQYLLHLDAYRAAGIVWGPVNRILEGIDDEPAVIEPAVMVPMPSVFAIMAPALVRLEGIFVMPAAAVVRTASGIIRTAAEGHAVPGTGRAARCERPAIVSAAAGGRGWSVPAATPTMDDCDCVAASSMMDDCHRVASSALGRLPITVRSKCWLDTQ